MEDCVVITSSDVFVVRWDRNLEPRKGLSPIGEALTHVWKQEDSKLTANRRFLKKIVFFNNEQILDVEHLPFTFQSPLYVTLADNLLVDPSLAELKDSIPQTLPERRTILDLRSPTMIVREQDDEPIILDKKMVNLNGLSESTIDVSLNATTNGERSKASTDYVEEVKGTDEELKAKYDKDSIYSSKIDWASNLKFYSLEEVAAHNKKDDLWIIIRGKVYDCTDYLKIHPGGKKLLLSAGKDGTRLFNAYHKWVKADAFLAKNFKGYLNLRDQDKCRKTDEEKERRQASRVSTQRK
eukprot:CAMPEP_0114997198 /NCGR_PEP_ID=MMETSP0216-20121206/14762_1 /TAXON_ID=223996 /ORGANISM="Protocruzia adherens, Strain Boccale" /LENGTH=295 /DNA_ID=CAMNT_0002361545 /DNA_START=94 /DNA_END=981 /DNA_ORIENTATION=-